MTKSAKRKKEKVSDFTVSRKPKLKLGKGKQPATNGIDTSFKARSIALPQQSITVTKDVLTTKRRLTLEDLLAHLKHYSAGVRKDALQGLYELLGEHRSLIEPNLLKLVNACVRLISDEDASVRKRLHSFFAWLLPRISREYLAPHAPTLLLFTASAQTHIFPEIRIDAIRILDLLLEFVPEQVVGGFLDAESGGDQGGHGRKILDGYLGLLNVGARFGGDESKGAGSSSAVIGQLASLVTLSTASKATVLHSFSKFLLCATASSRTPVHHTPDDPIPLWYLSPSFYSPEAFDSFAKTLHLNHSSQTSQCRTCFWNPENDIEDEDDFFGLFPLSDASVNTTKGFLDLEGVSADIDRLASVENSADDLDSTGARLTASLCRTVHPVLVSTFLDFAPSVFSPTQSSPAAELELMLALMEISRCLYGRLLRDGKPTEDQKNVAHEELKVLIGHMTIYFPFSENRMVAQDIKSEIVFQQMNLIYCELFSLRSLADYTSDAHHSEGVDGPKAKRRKLSHLQPKTPKASASAASAAMQVARVQEYVVRCLHGSAALGASSGAHRLGQALTAQTYVALLPTIWWLLDRPADDGGDSSEVLDAILKHSSRAGSTSGVKLAATEFVARLVLLQSEPFYRGKFRVGRFSSEDLQIALQAWLLHLPKVLWELGDKNLAATELILLFILRLAQRSSWLNDAEVSVALRTRLQPFFTMQHTTRGELRGPYARLNKPLADQQTSVPNREGQRSTMAAAPLKRLALGVAATLVQAGQADPHTASYLPPRAQDGRGAGYGIATRSGSGSGTASAPAPDLGTIPEEESKEGLRRAVAKAVAETAESSYWLGVSRA